MGRIAKLRVMWEQLNAEHFGGRLTPVPIRVTRSRRTYGYFNGPNNGGAASIRISVVLSNTDQLLRETMLHEMIHQALHAVGAEDWDGHGDAFQLIHQQVFGHVYVETE
jgi:predicted SprT family Zn-dependent metalloprotease